MLEGRLPSITAARRTRSGSAMWSTIPDSDLHHVMDPRRCWPSATPSRTSPAKCARGELIATFQDFKNFLPDKKRYMSLAEDLDAVRVWGCGKVPKNCGKIDFVQTDEERLKRYWLVLFDSPRARAVLLCKQVNKATISRTKSSSASTASIPIWCSRSAGASTC